jgi:hypothetical protein
VDFTSVLGEYKAVCDWPANYFYKEIMQAYPDAKVGRQVLVPEECRPFATSLRQIQ